MRRTLATRVGAITCGLVLATAALAACTQDDPATTAADAADVTTTTSTVDGSVTATQVLADDETPVDADLSYAAASVVDQPLSGSTSVTIDAAGTYRLHGTLTGQVAVDAPGQTVRLILDGVTITNNTGPAIAIMDADQVIVLLAGDNTLRDASSYPDGADADAALFSKADLTIASDPTASGTGTLTVHGRGNDAIASKDGLVIDSGTITVDAVDDGIRGKDYLVVRGGTVTVTSGGDGLKADNDTDADDGYIWVDGGTVGVTATGDGVAAQTDLVVTGGALTVKAGGGHTVTPTDTVSTKATKSTVITVLAGGTVTLDSADDAVHSNGAIHFDGATVSAASGDDGVHADSQLIVSTGSVAITSSVEGLESQHISVAGGDITVVASDDGINASGSNGTGGTEQVGPYDATISGGTLTITSGADALDSNGTATITGGTITLGVAGGRGEDALDVNGTLVINGGLVVGVGGVQMESAPSSSSAQGWLAATVSSSVTAGASVQVVGTDGTVVATFTAPAAGQYVIFSSSAITSGSQYRLQSGGTTLATVTAGQAAAGGGMGGGGAGGGFGGGQPR